MLYVALTRARSGAMLVTIP
ncbi:hypothetical protein ACFSTJ_20115 [Ottowia pentelensis]